MRNYIRIFKYEIATKLREKDQNIQVIDVIPSPPSINFQINPNSGQKIDIKRIDFSSLGIDVEVQNLLDEAELSIDMFEPKYNMSWDTVKSKTQ